MVLVKNKNKKLLSLKNQHWLLVMHWNQGPQDESLVFVLITVKVMLTAEKHFHNSCPCAVHEPIDFIS